jgi:hypothetical protein
MRGVDLGGHGVFSGGKFDGRVGSSGLVDVSREVDECWLHFLGRCSKDFLLALQGRGEKAQDRIVVAEEDSRMPARSFDDLLCFSVSVFSVSHDIVPWPEGL